MSQITQTHNKQHDNRLEAAVYGEAVADALGVPYEFRQRDTFTCTDMVGGGAHRQPAGTFSDDSSMMLATLDSLNHRNGHVDPSDLLARFRAWRYDGAYTADGTVFDVGGTTNFALTTGQGGDGERDNGNGSLMRIIPLAFFEVSDDEIRAASAVTHAHHISTEACVAYVHAARGLLNGRSPREVAAEAGYDGIWNTDRDDIRSGGFVLDTLRAALWCLTTTSSYAECVLKAVNLGSDTDTTAAVAGALAGIVYGFAGPSDNASNGTSNSASGNANGIPEAWVEALRGKTVIDRILAGEYGDQQ